jgi:ABC-2 type transport system permease protein
MINSIPSEKPSMGRFRRLRALIRKEAYQIYRDPSSIIITIVLPMILLFLYGYGVSLDLDHLRIGVVMEDFAPDAQSFVKSLTDSKYFDVKIVRDRRELQDEITRGSIRGMVVIPSYFSAFRSRPQMIAPIQVIADGSEPNTANFVQNYVKGAFWNWLIQEGISSALPGLPHIDIETRYWYNEELESRYFLLSGSLAIIMTLIGTLLTSLVVAREWERGTMEALMSTPVGIVEIVLSKLISYFCLGMISMIICVMISTWFYGLPLRGSLWLLTLVSAVFLLSALGTGLLISTYSKNQLVASQLATLLGFLPAYMLSGFLFEIASMPPFIRALTHIIPARYFVQCLQTLFLVGNVWNLVLWNIVPMLGISAILFLITARKTVKRLD